MGQRGRTDVVKSDLAVLDRKITAKLAPKKEEQDGEEVKPDDKLQQSQRVEASDKSTDTKGSMVAEPQLLYHKSNDKMNFIRKL